MSIFLTLSASTPQTLEAGPFAEFRSRNCHTHHRSSLLGPRTPLVKARIVTAFINDGYYLWCPSSPPSICSLCLPSLYLKASSVRSDLTQLTRCHCTVERSCPVAIHSLLTWLSSSPSLCHPPPPQHTTYHTHPSPSPERQGPGSAPTVTGSAPGLARPTDGPIDACSGATPLTAIPASYAVAITHSVRLQARTLAADDDRHHWQQR